MRLGLIGGTLVIGGCLLLVLAGSIFASGGAVGMGVVGVGGMTVTGAVALLGFGAVVLSIGGPWPMGGRGVRVGLGLVAIGLLAELVVMVLANASRFAYESPPIIVMFLLGGPIAAIGWLVTIASLLRSSGRPRQVGRLFLAGLFLTIVAGSLRNAVGIGSADENLFGSFTLVLAMVGGIAMLLGVMAVGALAIGGSRVDHVVSA